MEKGVQKNTIQKGKPLKNDTGSKKLKNIVLPLISIIIIVLAIIGGTFYLLMHFNINNLGEKYRKSLQDKPVFAWILPEPKDPEDPEYMTGTQIRSKYIALKNENESLKNQLNKALEAIEDLTGYKNETQVTLEGIEDERKKLENDINEFEKMVVSQNESGFRQYFEQVSPEAAAGLYSEIITKQEAQEELKKIAEIYEGMDSKAAAAIINEMGIARQDFIVCIFNAMETGSVAKIMALIDKKLATLVTESMYTLK